MLKTVTKMCIYLNLNIWIFNSKAFRDKSLSAPNSYTIAFDILESRLSILFI